MRLDRPATEGRIFKHFYILTSIIIIVKMECDFDLFT